MVRLSAITLIGGLSGALLGQLVGRCLRQLVILLWSMLVCSFSHKIFCIREIANWRIELLNICKIIYHRFHFCIRGSKVRESRAMVGKAYLRNWIAKKQQRPESQRNKCRLVEFKWSYLRHFRQWLVRTYVSVIVNGLYFRNYRFAYTLTFE